MDNKIPIEISARHIHLCPKDIDVLFGSGYELNILKRLSQSKEYAAKETVSINYLDSEGNKIGELKKVRVIGPFRENTQLEIAITDARNIKANPPIRISGDIKETPGFEIVGLKGKVKKEQGMIVAQRHLHVSPEEAIKLKLKNGAMVCLQVEENSDRKLIFCDILVRVRQDYKLVCHLDTDEGNAAGINNSGWGKIISD